jgi:hypothetical protein
MERSDRRRTVVERIRSECRSATTRDRPLTVVPM